MKIFDDAMHHCAFAESVMLQCALVALSPFRHAMPLLLWERPWPLPQEFLARRMTLNPAAAGRGSDTLPRHRAELPNT
jgi:hypothetical protein